MEYDIGLGLMATDAISALTRARGIDQLDSYRAFLTKSAEYCQSLRVKYEQITTIPTNIPQDAQHFLDAVKQAQHPSASILARLEIVRRIETLISQILAENRIPTKEERLEIARGLQRSSAAAWE